MFWSENGELVAITTDESYFILSFNQTAVTEAGPASGGGDERSEDGIEAAFDVSLPNFCSIFLKKSLFLQVLYNITKCSAPAVVIDD